MSIKDEINRCTNEFIIKLNNNKSMEVLFKKYFASQNIDNKLNLLQYTDSYILSLDKSKKDIIYYIFSYIASKKKNGINLDISKSSFIKEYAIYSKTLKAENLEKCKNKINNLLKKSSVNDILKFLKINILNELDNSFDYSELICDLIFFNKSKTMMKWGNDYYREINNIERNEENV